MKPLKKPAKKPARKLKHGIGDDLSIRGLKGDGSSKSLKTGVKVGRSTLERFMAEIAKQPREFHPSVWVQPEHGLIEICLEDVACYHEWIQGEGGDISIWHAQDNNRVVGATLPLRKWKGFLGQIIG